MSLLVRDVLQLVFVNIRTADLDDVCVRYCTVCPEIQFHMSVGCYNYITRN